VAAENRRGRGPICVYLTMKSKKPEKTRETRRSASKKNHGVSRREEEQHGEKKDL
jgi:hypothetical protein